MKTFEWVSDPSFRELFLIRGAVSWAGHVRYFENLLADPSQRAYSIHYRDRHVGNCGLKHMAANSGSAELWIYIGDSSTRGLGVGKTALGILLNTASSVHNIKHICVHALRSNTPAIRLYEFHGFVEKGDISREWLVRELDILRMEWSVE